MAKKNSAIPQHKQIAMGLKTQAKNMGKSKIEGNPTPKGTGPSMQTTTRVLKQATTKQVKG